jgi:hypothetical protein
MTEHLSAKQYQEAIAKPQRGNKYKAQRTLLDGICFDSQAEAHYYAALKLRERAGEVEDVEMQRSYALTINGVLVCTYRADFVFWDVAMKRRRVIDVKGVVTPVFRIKQKLMKACHGLEVEVVK